MNASDQRTFRFLQNLAADLSGGKLSFTTFADATVKVRLALNDPALTAEKLAAIIVAEPLLPVKLLRVANSASLNPSGNPVKDVKAAVVRVGHATIRNLAVNVALSQLTHLKDLEQFAVEARAVLRHSADVAALAYIIAGGMTRVNRDEALFAGIVHDIGRFYLWSRIGKYHELKGATAEIANLVDAWHPAVGHAILASLGASEAVCDAVNRHEDGDFRSPPVDLPDVLNIANRVSHSENPLNRGSVSPDDRDPLVTPDVFQLLDDAAEDLCALASALQS